MADALTSSSSLAYDTTAYNTLMWFDLRPELYFDGCADVASTPQTHRGSSVQFDIVHDLAVASTPLSENVDPDSVALSDAQVTVTLQEYGNSVKTTAFARNTAYIPLNPVVASAIGFNAGVSLDTVARNALVAGTNVEYGGNATSRTTIDSADIINSALIRKEYAKLAGANVATFGGFYRAFIHPDVAYDLKSETGDTGWRVVHNYSAPEAIMNGSLGFYEGFQFVVTPRASILTDASNGAGAAGTVDVYQTLFMGQQALAKAYSTGDGLGPMPNVVPGPVTDKLRRFVPLGWYWLGGYSIFRQACLRRIESASSIGAN